MIAHARAILTGVEKDLKELSTHAIPVFENLEVITEKVKNITENIDDQVEMVKHSINTIKEVADNIVSFERRVQERIEEPVLETVSVFAALFKGVRTFVERLRA
jgi:archaellum component FlaC